MASLVAEVSLAHLAQTMRSKSRMEMDGFALCGIYEGQILQVGSMKDETRSLEGGSELSLY